MPYSLQKHGDSFCRQAVAYLRWSKSQLLYPSKLDHISTYYLVHKLQDSGLRKTRLTASTLSRPSRLQEFPCASWHAIILCQWRSTKQYKPLIAYRMRR